MERGGLVYPEPRRRRGFSVAIIGSCYITDMRTAGLSWTLLLIALAASRAANVAKQSPVTENNKGAQEHARPSRNTARKIPCKTPENASLCYWTHGRLAVYNGNPSFRIWQIGRHHILGVFNGPAHYPLSRFEDSENPEFPEELNRAYAGDNRRQKLERGTGWTIPPRAYADFEVCPLRPEIKGWMQAVCIESAKKIVIEKDD